MELGILIYLLMRAVFVLIGVALLLKREWAQGVFLVAFGGMTHVGLILAVGQLGILGTSFWTVIFWIFVWMGLVWGIGQALEYFFPKKSPAVA